MKKPRRTSNNSFKLPTDVIVIIAFSIQEVGDLVAFLEALRGRNVLPGPLKQLYQLALTQDYSDWWPSLHIKSWYSSCDEIAKYYSKVVIYAMYETDEIDWLMHHLNANASIEWLVEKFPNATEVDPTYWNLPITHVNISLKYDDFDFDDDKPHNTCTDLLPRLPRLTSISVWDADDNHSHSDERGYNALYDHVFEFVANCDHLTEIHVDGCELTGDNMTNLIPWFRGPNARVFHFAAGPNDWHGSDVDDDMKESFCQAMFNCQTLERLKITAWGLQDVDFTDVVLSMRSLELDELDSDALIFLASRLEGSKVTHFEFSAFDCSGAHELTSLLQVLPRTSIKSLIVSGLQCCCFHQDAWASLFDKCTLDILALGTIDFTSVFAANLALGIQKNQTIRRLELEWGNGKPGTVADIRRLIQSMAHPNRSVRVKRAQLKTSSGTFDAESVKSLHEFAIECRCEFKYVAL
ncbi:unnamed protein product [Aphanomyces euteiches]